MSPSQHRKSNSSTANADAWQSACWRALREKDPAVLHPFVYAVKTTGIYCLPACPSKQPKRENVRFFESSLEAEMAGYRACKRCKPRSPMLEDRRVALVRRVCRAIESSEETLSLNALAELVSISGSRLHRIFKELTGATPKQYADQVQALRLRHSLSAGESISSAIYAAGYGSSSRFYEKWAWILGMKPAVYGQHGQGELILFTILETILGKMLVASTRVGVCSIAFADDRESLLNELKTRFGQATLVEGDEQFRALVSQTIEGIQFAQAFDALPLDIQGTLFMRRVWAELNRIPAGKKLSYAEIAHNLGMPQAARAVGSACAKNALAIAIPCHRAVRSDGGLGGYRWGLPRKEQLLKTESDEAPTSDQ